MEKLEIPSLKYYFGGRFSISKGNGLTCSSRDKVPSTEEFVAITKSMPILAKLGLASERSN